MVQNISSTGALGDVNLVLGRGETLQSLTAPSLFGSVNLNGGTLIGTLHGCLFAAELRHEGGAIPRKSARGAIRRDLPPRYVYRHR